MSLTWSCDQFILVLFTDLYEIMIYNTIYLYKIGQIIIF